MNIHLRDAASISLLSMSTVIEMQIMGSELIGFGFHFCHAITFESPQSPFEGCKMIPSHINEMFIGITNKFSASSSSFPLIL